MSSNPTTSIPLKSNDEAIGTAASTTQSARERQLRPSMVPRLRSHSAGDDSRQIPVRGPPGKSSPVTAPILDSISSVSRVTRSMAAASATAYGLNTQPPAEKKVEEEVSDKKDNQDQDDAKKTEIHGTKFQGGSNNTTGNLFGGNTEYETQVGGTYHSLVKPHPGQPSLDRPTSPKEVRPKEGPLDLSSQQWMSRTTDVNVTVRSDVDAPAPTPVTGRQQDPSIPVSSTGPSTQLPHASFSAKTSQEIASTGGAAFPSLSLEAPQLPTMMTTTTVKDLLNQTVSESDLEQLANLYVTSSEDSTPRDLATQASLHLLKSDPSTAAHDDRGPAPSLANLDDQATLRRRETRPLLPFSSAPASASLRPADEGRGSPASSLSVERDDTVFPHFKADCVQAEYELQPFLVKPSPQHTTAAGGAFTQISATRDSQQANLAALAIRAPDAIMRQPTPAAVSYTADPTDCGPRAPYAPYTISDDAAAVIASIRTRASAPSPASTESVASSVPPKKRRGKLHVPVTTTSSTEAALLHSPYIAALAALSPTERSTASMMRALDRAQQSRDSPALATIVNQLSTLQTGMDAARARHDEQLTALHRQSLEQGRISATLQEQGAQHLTQMKQQAADIAHLNDTTQSLQEQFISLSQEFHILQQPARMRPSTPELQRSPPPRSLHSPPPTDESLATRPRELIGALRRNVDILDRATALIRDLRQIYAQGLQPDTGASASNRAHEMSLRTLRECETLLDIWSEHNLNVDLISTVRPRRHLHDPNLSTLLQDPDRQLAADLLSKHEDCLRWVTSSVDTSAALSMGALSAPLELAHWADPTLLVETQHRKAFFFDRLRPPFHCWTAEFLAPYRRADFDAAQPRDLSLPIRTLPILQRIHTDCDEPRVILQLAADIARHASTTFPTDFRLPHTATFIELYEHPSDAMPVARLASSDLQQRYNSMPTGTYVAQSWLEVQPPRGSPIQPTRQYDVGASPSAISSTSTRHSPTTPVLDPTPYSVTPTFPTPRLAYSSEAMELLATAMRYPPNAWFANIVPLQLVNIDSRRYDPRCGARPYRMPTHSAEFSGSSDVPISAMINCVLMEGFRVHAVPSEIRNMLIAGDQTTGEARQWLQAERNRSYSHLPGVPHAFGARAQGSYAAPSAANTLAQEYRDLIATMDHILLQWYRPPSITSDVIEAIGNMTHIDFYSRTKHRQVYQMEAVWNHWKGRILPEFEKVAPSSQLDDIPNRAMRTAIENIVNQSAALHGMITREFTHHELDADYTKQHGKPNTCRFMTQALLDMRNRHRTDTYPGNTETKPSQALVLLPPSHVPHGGASTLPPPPPSQQQQAQRQHSATKPNTPAQQTSAAPTPRTVSRVQFHSRPSPPIRANSVYTDDSMDPRVVVSFDPDDYDDLDGEGYEDGEDDEAYGMYAASTNPTQRGPLQLDVTGIDIPEDLREIVTLEMRPRSYDQRRPNWDLLCRVCGKKGHCDTECFAAVDGRVSITFLAQSQPPVGERRLEEMRYNGLLQKIPEGTYETVKALVKKIVDRNTRILEPLFRRRASFKRPDAFDTTLQKQVGHSIDLSHRSDQRFSGNRYGPPSDSFQPRQPPRRYDNDRRSYEGERRGYDDARREHQGGAGPSADTRQSASPSRRNPTERSAAAAAAAAESNAIHGKRVIIDPTASPPQHQAVIRAHGRTLQPRFSSSTSPHALVALLADVADEADPAQEEIHVKLFRVEDLERLLPLRITNRFISQILVGISNPSAADEHLIPTIYQISVMMQMQGVDDIDQLYTAFEAPEDGGHYDGLVTALLDTGASTSLIREQLAKDIKATQFQTSPTILRGFNADARATVNTRTVLKVTVQVFQPDGAARLWEFFTVFTVIPTLDIPLIFGADAIYRHNMGRVQGRDTVGIFRNADRGEMVLHRTTQIMLGDDERGEPSEVEPEASTPSLSALCNMFRVDETASTPAVTPPRAEQRRSTRLTFTDTRPDRGTATTSTIIPYELEYAVIEEEHNYWTPPTTARMDCLLTAPSDTIAPVDGTNLLTSAYPASATTATETPATLERIQDAPIASIADNDSDLSLLDAGTWDSENDLDFDLPNLQEESDSDDDDDNDFDETIDVFSARDGDHRRVSVDMVIFEAMSQHLHQTMGLPTPSAAALTMPSYQERNRRQQLQRAIFGEQRDLRPLSSFSPRVDQAFLDDLQASMRIADVITGKSTEEKKALATALVAGDTLISVAEGLVSTVLGSDNSANDIDAQDLNSSASSMPACDMSAELVQGEVEMTAPAMAGNAGGGEGDDDGESDSDEDAHGSDSETDDDDESSSTSSDDDDDDDSSNEAANADNTEDGNDADDADDANDADDAADADDANDADKADDADDGSAEDDYAAAGDDSYPTDDGALPEYESRDDSEQSDGADPEVDYAVGDARMSLAEDEPPSSESAVLSTATVESNRGIFSHAARLGALANSVTRIAEAFARAAIKTTADGDSAIELYADLVAGTGDGATIISIHLEDRTAQIIFQSPILNHKRSKRTYLHRPRPTTPHYPPTELPGFRPQEPHATQVLRALDASRAPTANASIDYTADFIATDAIGNETVVAYQNEMLSVCGYASSLGPLPDVVECLATIPPSDEVIYLTDDGDRFLKEIRTSHSPTLWDNQPLAFLTFTRGDARCKECEAACTAMTRIHSGMEQPLLNPFYRLEIASLISELARKYLRAPDIHSPDYHWEQERYCFARLRIQRVIDEINTQSFPEYPKRPGFSWPHYVENHPASPLRVQAHLDDVAARSTGRIYYVREIGQALAFLCTTRITVPRMPLATIVFCGDLQNITEVISDLQREGLSYVPHPVILGTSYFGPQYQPRFSSGSESSSEPDDPDDSDDSRVRKWCERKSLPPSRRFRGAAAATETGPPHGASRAGGAATAADTPVTTAAQPRTLAASKDSQRRRDAANEAIESAGDIVAGTPQSKRPRADTKTEKSASLATASPFSEMATPDAAPIRHLRPRRLVAQTHLPEIRTNDAMGTCVRYLVNEGYLCESDIILPTPSVVDANSHHHDHPAAPSPCAVSSVADLSPDIDPNLVQETHAGLELPQSPTLIIAGERPLVIPRESDHPQAYRVRIMVDDTQTFTALPDLNARGIRAVKHHSSFLYCSADHLQPLQGLVDANFRLREASYTLTSGGRYASSKSVPKATISIPSLFPLFRRKLVAKERMHCDIVAALRQFTFYGIEPTQEPVVLVNADMHFENMYETADEGISPTAHYRMGTCPRPDRILQLTPVASGFAFVRSVHLMIELRDKIEDRNVEALSVFESTIAVMSMIYTMCAHQDYYPVGHIKERLAYDLHKWIHSPSHRHPHFLSDFLDSPATVTMDRSSASCELIVRKRAISIIAVLFSTDTYSRTYMRDNRSCEGLFRQIFCRLIRHWHALPAVDDDLSLPVYRRAPSAQELSLFSGLYATILASTLMTTPVVNSTPLMVTYMEGVSHLREFMDLSIMRDADWIPCVIRDHLRPFSTPEELRPPTAEATTLGDAGIFNEASGLVARLLEGCRNVPVANGHREAELERPTYSQQDINVCMSGCINQACYWSTCYDLLVRITDIVTVTTDLRLHTHACLPKEYLQIIQQTRVPDLRHVTKARETGQCQYLTRMLQNLLLTVLSQVLPIHADQWHHVEYLRQLFISALAREDRRTLLYRAGIYINALFALTITYQDERRVESTVPSGASENYSRWTMDASDTRKAFRLLCDQALGLMTNPGRQLFYCLHRHMLDVHAFMLLYHAQPYILAQAQNLRQGTLKLVPGYEALRDPVAMGTNVKDALTRSYVLPALLPRRTRVKRIAMGLPRPPLAPLLSEGDPYAYLVNRDNPPVPLLNQEINRMVPLEFEILLNGQIYIREETIIRVAKGYARQMQITGDEDGMVQYVRTEAPRISVAEIARTYLAGHSEILRLMSLAGPSILIQRSRFEALAMAPLRGTQAPDYPGTWTDNDEVIVDAEHVDTYSESVIQRSAMGLRRLGRFGAASAVDHLLYFLPGAAVAGDHAPTTPEEKQHVPYVYSSIDRMQELHWRCLQMCDTHLLTSPSISGNILTKLKAKGLELRGKPWIAEGINSRRLSGSLRVHPHQLANVGWETNSYCLQHTQSTNPLIIDFYHEARRSATTLTPVSVTLILIGAYAQFRLDDPNPPQDEDEGRQYFSIPHIHFDNQDFTTWVQSLDLFAAELVYEARRFAHTTTLFPQIAADYPDLQRRRAQALQFLEDDDMRATTAFDTMTVERMTEDSLESILAHSGRVDRQRHRESNETTLHSQAVLRSRLRN